MKKVLIIGGAGYVGTSLIPQILEKKYDVTVYDRLFWGGEVLIPFLTHKNFHFIKGDVRNKSALAAAVKGQDVIVLLAAIVGFPACDANPQLAKDTNVGGARNLASLVSKDQYVLYASSGSNYGRVLEGICTEETPLNPISLYSRTKTDAEIVLMEKTTCTAYRPGTAFGTSPRLRLDLLPHQLTMDALQRKHIVLYEGNVIRPFIHVYDFGRAFVFAIEHFAKMKNEVYNLGADELNYTKRQMAEFIAKETGATIEDSDKWSDPDKRHYEVSYKKLQKLGYKHTLSIQDGIRQIIKAVPALTFEQKYSNAIEIIS